MERFAPEFRIVYSVAEREANPCQLTLKEKRVFSSVLSKPNRLRRRATYVEAACGGDTELKRRVEALLRRHDEGQGMLDLPPPGLPSTPDIPQDDESIGTLVGRYKLFELIGQGGFGVVYLAEQTEPVRRQVALKIIKLGMDTKQVIARFEAERQALAMMDHPNIAKVLDAGATETGRPYFVMELVQGVPITEHCDENKLTANERLQLFLDVCRAIQHAHLKGIIHRDIKPTNVMVTPLDSESVPKVIDFGIAKATQKGLTEKTSLTSDGQFLGTPQYMSPEQAGMSDLDVDIRTDVYSLGVLLYELLVGSTPFDPELLRQAGHDDMCRIIRETDPPTPSNQLSTLAAATTEVFKHRRTQPAALRKQLRGDLDCIVMKTLEKDRDDRYATVQALADDVRRHLQDVPIRARRPTYLERMIKKSHRHRAAVVVAGILLTVIMVGSMVSAALLWNEQRETDEALVVAQKERETAKQKAEEAQAISDFLVDDLLGSVDPKNAMGREVTVKEVLANAERKVDAAFGDSPLTEAAIRQTLARVFWQLGELKRARSHAERARELYVAHRGAQHVDTLGSTHLLAIVLRAQDELTEARKLAEFVLAAYRQIHGPEHADTLTSMNHLACILSYQKKHEEARQLHEQVVDTRLRILGPENEATLTSMLNLGGELWYLGRSDDARKLFEQVLETRQRILGPEHPSALRVMHNLGVLFGGQGQLDRARELLEQSLYGARRVFGADHEDTWIAMNSLGNVLRDQGELEEACKLQEQALESRRRMLGPDHPHTLGQMTNLALILIKQGKLKEARTLYEQALDTEPRSLGSGAHLRKAWMQNLAWILSEQGEFAEACRIEEERLEENWRAVGPCHIETSIAAGDLIEARIRQEGKTDILGCYAEMDSIERGEQIGRNIFFLATAFWKLGDKEEARRWHDRAIEWMVEHNPNDKELARYRDEAAKLISSEDDDKTTNTQED